MLSVRSFNWRIASAPKVDASASSLRPVIIDEQEAIDAALKMGRQGDLLLIFADALARGWKQIVNFNASEHESVVPAPRAARAVPREAPTEEAPADDVVPARTPAPHQPMPIT